MTALGGPQRASFDLSDLPSADVAVYFSDGPEKLYQLKQWLPLFESHSDVRTVVVVRSSGTHQALENLTSLTVLFAPLYTDLMAFYDRGDFHAVIYVNNGMKNFQSLSFQQAVHIHVNHGESDKISMVSNQVKAYDRVFVAGEAAVQRHAAALAWFDQSRLVRVGRPQLDLADTEVIPNWAGPTISYAPTWEGEDDANNYTSVDRYGPQIISAALAQPGARVLYKPHPRVVSSRDSNVELGHRNIMSLIQTATASNPASGHAALLDSNVLDVIRASDIMIADVSSVALDHLYLRPDAPLMLCDRRTNRERLLRDAPVASGSHIIDRDTIDTLALDLTAVLAEDPMRSQRQELRDFYFDGLAPGQSTERFWQELGLAIADHDEALRQLSLSRTVETKPSASIESTGNR
jgi:hypothetical protein